ncbi:LOW QUALITY PROTEIN: golgin candidate 1-like [Actinidia eriantha]|uniref:LOW QUALITY PROTEIN: golgin candidate 1-like n=1 Tax=Actinidia eriantha TaxID=165200 RepID=UPI00258AB7E3|nr:LOW QUALITY PROTEIN: golgin candidate 1-like [Actinidia eriantha]
MASWFRAAEDLFEVVDRRAKLVVGEKPEEQSNSQTPAANGQGSQTKRTRLKAKAQKRLSSNETPKTIDTSLEHNSSEASESDVALDKDRGVSSIDNDGISLSNSNAEASNEDQLNVEKDRSLSASSLSETILNEEIKHKTVDEKCLAIVSNVEAIVPTSNGKPVNEGLSDGLERVSSSLLSVNGVEVVHKDPPADSGQNFRMGDAGSPKKIEQEGSQPVSVDTPRKVDTQLKDDDLKVESLSNQTKPQEHKADTSSVKIEDQLDEAQGLLKTSISTGQSKEARLARVCAGLQSRLQEYKSENAQLEELLIAERELSQSCEARIKQLQREISEAKNEATKVESNMAEALAAKNKEIEALLSSMDSLKKQAALSEGNLASLQANMESIMRSRELTETRMMQAVREELASAERRAEEERAAHNATKMAAMEREVELEHRAIEASTALARIQRTADERTSKAAELEQKVVLLEVECASLNQELQDMEARARRGPKKAPEEANQMIQMQAWQKEVERARQGQRDAESKLSSLEAEVQKMRVEMAAMKRDAEHYSRQEHMELEKRYRELTDLLYYKQTQLEAMASDKAAAEFQLEKEMKRLQEAQVEAERSRSSRRASSYWEEDNDMKELEPLPLHHRHMVGARMQLQKAAKFLDSGAVRATRFLWRYPTARVLLLFYLVFVHLFLMYLLHRLQEQDDTFASREVAESMGLANHTLP